MSVLCILSGGAAQGLVESLRAAFESETGHRIDGTFGAVGAMRDKLLAGAPADLLILTSAVIDGLERDGSVVSGSARDIGEVQTAIAVRHGDPVLRSAAPMRSARRCWPPTRSTCPTRRRRPPASISRR